MTAARRVAGRAPATASIDLTEDWDTIVALLDDPEVWRVYTAGIVSPG